MPQATRPADAVPFGTMNTTPLIDVLLVLLVMFIITIPVATNSLDVELPQGTSGPVVERLRNKVVVTGGGAVLWNGAQVSQPQLSGLLRESTLLAVEPQLEFEPAAEAGYDLSARVLATIKSSGVSNFGFVGNERYAEFGH